MPLGAAASCQCRFRAAVLRICWRHLFPPESAVKIQAGPSRRPMPPFDSRSTLLLQMQRICSKPAESAVSIGAPVAANPTDPVHVRKFCNHSLSSSEFAQFFVSKQQPITARKQRNNSDGTAEDPKHFGPNSILFGPMAGACRTLFVLTGTDVKPSANAGIAGRPLGWAQPASVQCSRADIGDSTAGRRPGGEEFASLCRV